MIWSMSISFRLGLGFHALNNEGADGSNLMQPRRIDVGETTYDGISGEIVRRHILENFVNLCKSEKPSVLMLPLSEGLHPDRGPLGIRVAAKELKNDILTTSVLYQSVRKALEKCAVLDVGGFLAAFTDEAKSQGGEEDSSAESIPTNESTTEGEQSQSSPSQNLQSDNQKTGKEKSKKKGYAVEKPYIERYCAELPKKGQGSIEPVKRESCFDVGWLISEEPQDLTVTQHSAFRDTASLNSRYAQTMRSNVYGGVIRADLHRVGMDDHWYLLDQERRAVSAGEQKRRQVALIKAIVNFIASPTGARTAGWAPHVFLTEGAILLTSARTAPFTSPIKVDLRATVADGDERKPVSANSNYRASMQSLENKTDTWVWPFDDVKGLISAGKDAIAQLEGVAQTNGQEESKS